MSVSVRALFLEDLAADLPQVREGLARGATHSSVERARALFHRVAGSAEPAGLAALGRLAYVGELVAELALARKLDGDERVAEALREVVRACEEALPTP